MTAEEGTKWIILIEEKEAVVSLLTEAGNLLVSDQKGWDGEDPKSLIASLDAGIGGCLAKEEGIGRPQKTIFLLPPFWVSPKGEVLPSHKENLKIVCQQLDLIPEGFLVGEEVLANFYDDFVSIYFGKEYLRFSVIKDKSVQVQEELENGEDIDPEDVSVFLRQLNGKAMLPKKMIFWGRIKEGNKDRLLSYPWQEEKVFTSAPQLKIFLWPEFFQMVAKVIQGEIKLEVVQTPIKSEQPIAASESIDMKSPVEKDDEFGFSSDDVAETRGWQDKTQPQVEEKTEITAEPELDTGPEPKPKPKPKLKLGLEVKKRLTKINFLNRKKTLILTAFPLLILAGFFLSWRFSKATIEIYVTGEDLSEELEVQLDPQAEGLDLDNGLVPVEEVSIEKSASKSNPTSGEKLVGEKAVGEVKVFNRTAEKAVFPSGTRLVGPGGLEFVFDDEVSVASKTADLSTGVDRWGEATASITAADIGPEYNLAADSLFTIENNPEDDYLARNSQALTGGTSRQIRAVSEDDQVSLRNDLSEELIFQAEEELKSKLSDSQIVKGSFSTQVIEESFSAEVGDEVESISLELTAKVTALRISQEQLIAIAEQVLGKTVDSNLEIKDGSLRAKLDVNEESEENLISGKLTLLGKAYPRIDEQDLSRQLAAKREKQAKQLIRSQYPRIYRYEISYQLPTLKILSYLPSQPENIIIEIKE